MITSYKVYETILNRGEPQEGDFVLCHKKNARFFREIELKNFLGTHIGQIYRVKKTKSTTTYFVEFEELPDSCKQMHTSNKRTFKLNDISYWSPNKKDVEQTLIQKRFDL